MKSLFGIIAITLVSTASMASELCVTSVKFGAEGVVQGYKAECGSPAKQIKSRKYGVILITTKKVMQEEEAVLVNKLTSEGYKKIELVRPAGYPNGYSPIEFYRKALVSESAKQMCITNGKLVVACTEGVSLAHDVLTPYVASVLLQQNGFRKTAEVKTGRYPVADYELYER